MGISLALSLYIYIFTCLVCLLGFFRSHLTRRSVGVLMASVTDTPASGAMSSLESEVVLKSTKVSLHTCRKDNFTRGEVTVLGYSIET
jgi:hypothetical protein